MRVAVGAATPTTLPPSDPRLASAGMSTGIGALGSIAFI
jgi:hypothetical protein